MGYDSTADTLKHIDEVRNRIKIIIQCLKDRATVHDASKLEGPEKEAFDQISHMMVGVEYGSDEYRETLRKFQPAIKHHQINNSHHPEAHDNGFADMDLIDTIELLCDWKSATLRNANGDIRKSLEINAKRFDMPDAIVGLLKNTIDNLGW